MQKLTLVGDPTAILNQCDIPFPQPPNEAERLAALYSLAILDTPSSPAIDRICRIAKQLFDVPMIHVTLTDAHRYFLKAKPEGITVSEVPREHAFCN
ncbi:hypothetical protein [Microvirga sp. BSC39]|uniref:hypothetical protein n=1 Tax=Microvirga sp. BSC39 TaxID=1549810 RepID=UPI000689F7C4|nr:hypothetical protein [Microvirga sp. BSC39]